MAILLWDTWNLIFFLKKIHFYNQVAISKDIVPLFCYFKNKSSFKSQSIGSSTSCATISISSSICQKYKCMANKKDALYKLLFCKRIERRTSSILKPTPSPTFF